MSELEADLLHVDDPTDLAQRYRQYLRKMPVLKVLYSLREKCLPKWQCRTLALLRGGEGKLSHCLQLSAAGETILKPTSQRKSLNASPKGEA